MQENLQLMVDLNRATSGNGRRIVTELLERFDLVESAQKPVSTGEDAVVPSDLERSQHPDQHRADFATVDRHTKGGDPAGTGGNACAMEIRPQDSIMGATVSGFEFGRASEKGPR